MYIYIYTIYIYSYINIYIYYGYFIPFYSKMQVFAKGTILQLSLPVTENVFIMTFLGG